MDDTLLQSQLRAALDLARTGHAAEAQALFERIHGLRPDCAEAAIALARAAMQRGDMARAQATLTAARDANADHEALAVEHAVCLATVGELSAAIAAMRRFVDRVPQSPMAWLLFGQLLDDSGQRTPALLARFEALRSAHHAGVWTGPQSTPPHLQALVGQAVHDVRAHRREVFFGVTDALRREHGGAALKRIDRALTGYLGEWDATPTDTMQRPRFFYVPDLPAQPFLDPSLQPWAPRLRAAFTDIRDEAVSLIREQQGLEDFVQVQEGDSIGNYLGGAQPSWEAFFFYRHGERYDANHARCPRTSAVLESLDLVRIPGQTPEICFSVLAPGTHILPHHGVTNTRTVMHLPLIVPEHCALNLVDRGEHRWREGELVMFDDTFLHEAWNHSDSVRVVLLMDCWNPHLTPVEREASVRIAQTIGVLDVALRDNDWPTP